MWLFDSLLTHKFTPSLQEQLVCICEAASRMEASSVPVQQQEGGTDCGHFTIAYPYHASVGDCLEEMVLDQGMMVSHLLHCFESQKL